MGAYKDSAEMNTPLVWEPVIGVGLQKFLRVFQELPDFSLAVAATKIGRKTVFACNYGVTRFYVAGDDGNIYAMKGYGRWEDDLPAVNPRTLQPLVDAAALGLTDEYRAEGVYTNGHLAAKKERPTDGT